MSNSMPSPTPIAIGGLVALAAAMGIGRFIYTPILPFMTADLGLLKSQVGLIASANFLGYLIGALIATLPRFRGHRRVWMLGGLLASTLALALMAAVETLWIMLLLRFIGGVCSALILLFTTSLVLEWLAVTKRLGLSSVHYAGVGTGIMLSSVVVWLATQAGFDWRGQWIAGALLSLLALIIAGWLIPNDPPRPPPDPTQPRHVRPSGLWMLITAYALFGFGYIITATFLISIVRKLFGDPSVEAGIWLLVGLAAIPTVAMWNAISIRIGVLKGFALACLVEAVGVGASIFGTSVLGPAISAILLGGTFMAITALGFAAARPFVSGGDMRRVTAAMTAAFGVGQMIGPSYAGLLYDWLGNFNLATVTASAALVTSAILVTILSRRMPGN